MTGAVERSLFRAFLVNEAAVGAALMSATGAHPRVGVPADAEPVDSVHAARLCRTTATHEEVSSLIPKGWGAQNNGHHDA